MDPSDFYSLLYDDQNQQAPQQALAAALRNQKLAGLQSQMLGRPDLARAGMGLMQDVDQRQNQMDTQIQNEPQKRLNLALGQEKLTEEKTNADVAAQRRAARANPSDPGTVALAKAAGVEPEVLGTLDDREFAALETALTRKEMAAQRAEGRRQTGEMKQKDVDAEFENFRKSVSTYSGRANLNSKLQDRLNKAENLEALVIGPGGEIQNLTPQQLREAATAVANLISAGQTSEGQIEALVPDSLAGKWANLKQKILNKPQGAEAQAFLQNMMDTAGREKKQVLAQIRRGQLQAVPGFAHLRKINPAKFESILKAPGVEIDPTSLDENGLQVAQPVAAQPSEGGVSGLPPEKQKRLEELRRKKAEGTLK